MLGPAGQAKPVARPLKSWAHSKGVPTRQVILPASASRHACQDDFKTDMADFVGKKVLILTSDAKRAGEYARYFRESEIKESTAAGATYTCLLGKGFNYAEYEEKVLRGIREKYYRIPAWLLSVDLFWR